MTCHIHNEQPAVGTCVGCGKFICEQCTIEMNGKNYCKKCLNETLNEKDKKINELENKPSNVYMNAGGGGGGGGASSSSSAVASGGMSGPYPRQKAWVHVLLFFLTGGIGNIVYYFYVRNLQDSWR